MTELQDDKRKALLLALDTYGADLARMPEPMAIMVKDLIDNFDEATALFEEAKVLDEAFNNAQNVDWDLESLGNNIITAAKRQLPKNQKQNKTETTVIDFMDSKQRMDNTPPLSQTGPANDNWIGNLATSGLLAASLLFGIFFGAFGGANTLMGDHTDLTIASADLSNDILLLDTDFNTGEE